MYFQKMKAIVGKSVLSDGEGKSGSYFKRIKKRHKEK